MASNRIKVGHYVLLETLGVGSFGKVKLAVHSLTGHKVAMKFINKRKIAGMGMLSRVQREIEYLKFLRHPHIIKLYEVITTPTDIIMVMEYAGGELFNYIVEKGRMSEDDVRPFFQQIICAVEYCHRHNIVHRDLKPENLLLDSHLNVKIADFGLSNIMTDGDFLKTSCGSPNYAAPEVISGKLYAGPEVDVWSCGVILYVMLCGRLPFDDDYIPNLFHKINGGIFTIPAFLSPETKYLLQSMLVVDPLKRITIAEIRQTTWFNQNLAAYLQPLPDAAYIPEVPSESIVHELSQKLNLPKQQIMEILTSHDSDDDQSDIEKEDEDEDPWRYVRVAYQLVCDNKMIWNKANGYTGASSGTSPPMWAPEPTVQPPISPTFTPPSSDPQHSTIQVLSSSLPSNFAALHISPPQSAPLLSPPNPHLRSASTPGTVFGSQRGNSSGGRYKTRSKWHVGIRSRSPPNEVMLEIFKALKSVGMEWKIVTPFHVRCRYTFDSINVTVKLDLQLYKVEHNYYLVDFKYIPPSSSFANSPQSSHSASSQSTSVSASAPGSAPASVSAKSPIPQTPTKSSSSYFPTSDSQLSKLNQTLTGSIPSARLSTGNVNGLAQGGKIKRRGSMLQARIGEDKVYTIFPFLEVCSRLITELAIAG